MSICSHNAWLDLLVHFFVCELMFERGGFSPYNKKGVIGMVY